MTYSHLPADCLYTGISSGPNARQRVWEAFTFFTQLSANIIKRGVALTGRNTNRPPSCAAAGELRCICADMEYYRLRQTTDDDRRQRAKQYWPPTLCVGGPIIKHIIPLDDRASMCSMLLVDGDIDIDMTDSSSSSSSSSSRVGRLASQAPTVMTH